MAIKYVNPDKESQQFLRESMAPTIHGNCYPVAIALHRGLGWPLIGLTNGVDIIHAGVRAPNGSAWDGRGEISEKEFSGPFEMMPGFSVQPITEQHLYPESSIETEHWIKHLFKKAQLAWPDLDWKIPTPQSRVLQFAKELEALSRKHGLWIAGSTPTSLPFVCHYPEAEVSGYEINLSAEGNAFTINRIF